MRNHRLRVWLYGIAMLAGTSPSLHADTFKVDGVHSFALFRVRHFNAGNVWGRFNDPAGEFTLDQADPSKDSFAVELKLAKLDTGNAKRDSDLQGPDWFNGRQFQTINFKSTAVKKGEGNMLEVTGDLTIHGVTKSVVVAVEVTGVAGQRAGVEGTVAVKRSDFGMKAMPSGVGDEVKLIVALEGTRGR